MSKKVRQKQVIKNSLEGYSKGYEHRNHRPKKTRRQGVGLINPKKEALKRIIEKDWEETRKYYNLIRTEEW